MLVNEDEKPSEDKKSLLHLTLTTIVIRTSQTVDAVKQSVLH